MLFNNCLKHEVFQREGEKQISQRHKKELKISNYRTVSLLSICPKMLAKLMFDDIYNFLDHNCLTNNKHNASDLDSIFKPLVFDLPVTL